MNEAAIESPLVKLSVSDVRAIAIYQKTILVCILLYLIIIASLFVLSSDLRLPVAIITESLKIIAAIFVFKLAIRIRGTNKGVLLGILTLIPVIGLFILLHVNSLATAALRSHGIDVGLLGAKSIPN